MTITYTKGDLFSSDAELLICPVNTEGELEEAGFRFKEHFPYPIKAYKEFCKRKGFDDFGKILVHRTAEIVLPGERERYVCFFPTTFKSGGHTVDLVVSACINALYSFLKEKGVKHVASPVIESEHFTGQDFVSMVKAQLKPQENLLFEVFQEHD